MSEAVIVGAGTVTREEEARQVIAAGARFIVCPHVNVRLIEAAHAQGVPIFPGAFTPTEIITAHQAGADLVKLFPAMPAGPEYLTQLRGPLPHIPFVPTGGITPENAPAFLKAGARAVALGGSVFNAKIKESFGLDWFHKRVSDLVKVVRG